MANLRLPDDSRDEILKAIRDLIDAGSGAGKLNIYDGSQPASANTAVSDQTLLAELTLADPCAPDPSTPGELEFSAITRDEEANATGTASWARVTDSDGNVVFDCDVGTSGASLILNTTSLVAGGPVEVTSFILRCPAG